MSILSSSIDWISNGPCLLALDYFCWKERQFKSQMSHRGNEMKCTLYLEHSYLESMEQSKL